MDKRNNIYDMYFSDFQSFKIAQEYKNPNFVITEDLIKESLIKTKERFIGFFPDVNCQSKFHSGN